MTDKFDVFLCHNSEDKPQVKQIAEQLKQYELKPWLDVWELRPGLAWQRVLEEQIEQIQAAAVFVGKNGLGPWQRQEIDAFLRKFVSLGCPVIPILLPDAPKEPNLPLFLEGIMWVDFRSAEPEPMNQLIWGITGKKPSLSSPSPPVSPSPEIHEEILPNGFILEMVKIPAGSFLMGTEKAEVVRLCKQHSTDWYKCELPQHRVNLKEFYLGKYPVTQEQYQAVMGENPSYFKDNSKNPVEQVSWQDAQAFCQKLKEITGENYRLLTEAEWEYACRAGSQTRYYFGNDENQLGEYAWFDENSDGKAHPVGLKKPNAWGLYDMSGNVWEWCEDPWYDSYANKPDDTKNNGNTIWSSSNESLHALRGGSWYYDSGYCRSAYRGRYDAESRNDLIGFRLALSVS